MKYFFDTSALVKLFQAENGSEIVEEIVNDPDNDLWVLLIPAILTKKAGQFILNLN